MSSITIVDNAGNSKYYDEEPNEEYSEKLPNQLTLEIKNEKEEDAVAPTISKISAEKTELKAGETTAITIEAEDDVSGISFFSAVFRKEGTEDNYISTDFSTQENPYAAELRLSPYLPSGTYVLSSITIVDNAGNSKYYDEEPIEEYSESLPNALSLTVINDDSVTPPPTDSVTPSTTDPSGSAVTPGTPINYESEKPDPADKQAVELYNFWQKVKLDVRLYKKAGSLRIYIPSNISYMPASAMETLRVENVPVTLQWNGHRIAIPAGKAQPKQPLKAYWPMEKLCELYNA